jgi:hypothetical protein
MGVIVNQLKPGDGIVSNIVSEFVEVQTVYLSRISPKKEVSKVEKCAKRCSDWNARLEDTVTIHYIGTLLDDTKVCLDILEGW